MRDGGWLRRVPRVVRRRERGLRRGVAASLQRGAAAGLARSEFISAYASSHPWEDFAETWAHYLHIVDALETARSYGIDVRARFVPDATKRADRLRALLGAERRALVDAWVPLTVALNGVNRSMGQPDLYPFVLNVDLLRKLEFVHELIRDSRGYEAGAGWRGRRMTGEGGNLGVGEGALPLGEGCPKKKVLGVKRSELSPLREGGKKKKKKKKKKFI